MMCKQKKIIINIEISYEGKIEKQNKEQNMKER